jgi:hypothetical protein
MKDFRLVRSARPRRVAALLWVVLASALLASLACGGAGTKVEPVPDPEPGADAAPGVLRTPPAGATQVAVALTEFEVAPDQTSVAAGQVYFLATNSGREPHELVVIRTDLPADALPVEDGRVPEDEVDMIGEIEPFAAGSSASAVFGLEPGGYVLICNIVEEEGGGTESHYLEGMRAAFTVQ